MYIHTYIHIFPWTVREMTDMRSETLNVCGSPSTALRSAGPESTKGQISYQCSLASSRNTELESGACTEASNTIWDTMGSLRMADMTMPTAGCQARCASTSKRALDTHLWATKTVLGKQGPLGPLKISAHRAFGDLFLISWQQQKIFHIHNFLKNGTLTSKVSTAYQPISPWR